MEGHGVLLKYSGIDEFGRDLELVGKLISPHWTPSLVVRVAFSRRRPSHGRRREGSPEILSPLQGTGQGLVFIHIWVWVATMRGR